MIRPEIRAQLSRFREAIAGALVAVLGGYWLFSIGIVMQGVGLCLLIAGLAVVWTGWQRGRFRSGPEGPGVVQVVEGRVAYFGPLGGGMADISALMAVTLDPTATPAHWMLHRPGDVPLAIPVTAKGADALFDAFTQLKGIDTEALLRARSATGPGPITVWRRDPPDQVARLH